MGVWGSCFGVLLLGVEPLNYIPSPSYFLFWDTISLNCPGWPEMGDPPVSISPVTAMTGVYHHYLTKNPGLKIIHCWSNMSNLQEHQKADLKSWFLCFKITWGFQTGSSTFFKGPWRDYNARQSGLGSCSRARCDMNFLSCQKVDYFDHIFILEIDSPLSGVFRWILAILVKTIKQTNPF